MPDLFPAQCPYCGEPIELAIDASAGSASYVEDCQVCCRPIQVEVEIAGDDISVRLKSGND